MPDLQRFTFGFINGTNTIKTNRVCAAALLSTVDQAFNVVDVRFVWIPEYTIKFQTAQSKLTDYANTAYAYCNFGQFFNNISSLFDSNTPGDIGKLISRVAGSMLGDWWYKTNCIVDGFLGENYYDIGYCAGNLFIVVFDTTLG